MRKTGFIYSPLYLKHETGEHPENPSRLTAIVRSLDENHILKNLIRMEPLAASLDQIARVHELTYVHSIERACAETIARLDSDTVISPHSYTSARLASGGVIKAIDAVLSGEIDNAFCAVRPPGHHAEHDRAMGFCLFNNVAVAARYALAEQGVKRVFIVDWDVHHGNGTQNAFYDDPRVFYVSLHQYPHYPGTGREAERGSGPGEGFTMNFPLAAGSGEMEYMAIMENKIYGKIIEFRPELLLISAGFDAHGDDPLSSMTLSSKSFRVMTDVLIRAASKVCEGRIVSTLEGGYDLHALGESVGYHLSALLGLEG